jgi:phosphoglycerate dehydrogenase-like enzyme
VNTEGSNRNSIVEWVVFMTLSLFREFPSALNVKQDILLQFTTSLQGLSVVIIGKGNIGTKIGEVLEGFDMNVMASTPFLRHLFVS